MQGSNGTRLTCVSADKAAVAVVNPSAFERVLAVDPRSLGYAGFGNSSIIAR